jgi:hypothetical protein
VAGVADQMPMPDCRPVEDEDDDEDGAPALCGLSALDESNRFETEEHAPSPIAAPASTIVRS